jgi:hypothetical protein
MSSRYDTGHSRRATSSKRKKRLIRRPLVLLLAVMIRLITAATCDENGSWGLAGIVGITGRHYALVAITRHLHQLDGAAP